MSSHSHCPSPFLPQQLPGEAFSTHEVTLVEYRTESVTLFRHEDRMSLSTDTYSLTFKSVVASDSGVYLCRVNNKDESQYMVRLIVEGKLTLCCSVACERCVLSGYALGTI